MVKLPGLGASLEMSRISGWLNSFPEYKLISVDPRGHGKSEQPKDPKAHRIEEYRDDVLAVLDTLNIEKVKLLGISDGAQIGCAFASTYPDRTSALIDLDGFDDQDLCDPPVSDGRISLARTIRSRGWGTLFGRSLHHVVFRPTLR